MNGSPLFPKYILTLLTAGLGFSLRLHKGKQKARLPLKWWLELDALDINSHVNWFYQVDTTKQERF